MKTLQDYKNMNCFNKKQLKQIRKGLKNNIDVSIYAKPEFNEWQMKQIKFGIYDGLDASTYANPKLDADKMYLIRKWLLE